MIQQLIYFDLRKKGRQSDFVSRAASYKVTCLVLVLLTTLMLLSCENNNPEPTAGAFIEKARAYVRQHNTWDAITEYRNATRLDPENGIAYFELAENLVMVNSISNAIETYKKAAAINPENKYAKLRLGQIYLSSGKISEAREIISSVLATYPQDIEAHHLLTSIEIMEKNFDAAIEILKKAMLIAEENIKTRLTLASLYMISSKQGLAEAMYKDILAIDPSQRLPYMELCELYWKDKAWGKMEDLLLDVLETPGIRETKLTDLARFYEGQKKYSTAQTYYDRAVDEFPQSIQALMNLAEFYTRRNNRDNAITTMKKALNLSPDNLECMIGLAQVYLAFDMPNYSWHEINKAVELDNYNLDANFIVGKLLIKRGDYKGANDYISWVISQGFTNADAYHLRAMCTKHQVLLEGQNQELFKAAPRLLHKAEVVQREKMKKDLQKALMIDANKLKSRIELIEIYLYEKNIAKADEHLGFAFRQSPRNPRLFILTAALKIFRGDRDGAIKIYTAIVEQNPSYIPGHLRLALLYTASGKIDQALHSYVRAYEIDPQQISILKKISDIHVSKKSYKKAMAFLNSRKIPKDKISQAFVENLRGEIFVKARDERNAINSFQKAIVLDPTAIIPKMNMAGLFMGRNQIEKAKAIYLEIERAKPDHFAMVMALGYLYEMEGKTQQAETQYRKALKIDPEHANAANNLAYLLLKTEAGLEEAFSLASQAKRKDPISPSILDTMGQVYYKKGLYQYAISEFKESIKLNPNIASTCYHLGMTYYNVQKFELALTYLQKALVIDTRFDGSDIARQLINRITDMG